jgi:hypothetical protein
VTVQLAESLQSVEQGAWWSRVTKQFAEGVQGRSTGGPGTQSGGDSGIEPVQILFEGNLQLVGKHVTKFLGRPQGREVRLIAEDRLE